MTTPPEPNVLSAVQFRTLARCVGASLPALLHPAYPPEDWAEAQLEAVEELTAAGMLDDHGNYQTVTADARDLLDPLLRPDVVVSIEDAADQSLVVANRSGARLLTEILPDLWLVEPSEETAIALAVARIGELRLETDGALRTERTWGPEVIATESYTWTTYDGALLFRQEDLPAATILPEDLRATLTEAAEAVDQTPTFGA